MIHMYIPRVHFYLREGLGERGQAEARGKHKLWPNRMRISVLLHVAIICRVRLDYHAAMIYPVIHAQPYTALFICSSCCGSKVVVDPKRQSAQKGRPEPSPTFLNKKPALNSGGAKCSLHLFGWFCLARVQPDHPILSPVLFPPSSIVHQPATRIALTNMLHNQ
jgi:hypothetical protein